MAIIKHFKTEILRAKATASQSANIWGIIIIHSLLPFCFLRQYGEQHYCEEKTSKVTIKQPRLKD